MFLQLTQTNRKQVMKSLRRATDAAGGWGSSTSVFRSINDNVECFSWLPLKQIIKTSLACQSNIQNDKMNLRQE